MSYYKNTATTIVIPGLKDAAGRFVDEPTLATGDVKISKDGGAFANLGTLPTTVSGECLVVVSLTAAEMNADSIVIQFEDAAGAEWIRAFLSFNTDSVSKDVLADTAELQTNQGNWLTATGFSTHNASDVTDDINTDATFAAARALAITNGITNNPSIISILADTDDLQTNQGDWLTATGFSTHSATAVWQVDSTQLWPSDTFGLKSSTSFSEITSILADTVQIQTDLTTIDGVVDSILEDTTAIQSTLGSGADVTVVSVVVDSTVINLDEGDRYDGTSRPALAWTVAKDYTGATIQLRIWREGDDGATTTMKTASGSVDSATELSVSMTAEFDADLAFDGHPAFEKLRFALVATVSSNEETIAKGDCYVYQRI